jgi:flavodoxin
MKALVTYFSQTGNTEKLAQAVYDEISGSHEAKMAKLEDVDASALSGHDVVFVGSPIHAGGLADPVKALLGTLSANPGFALAGLVTHASDVYSKENYEKGLEALEAMAKEKGVKYLGCFDCQGKLMQEIRPMVQQGLGLSDEEWAKRMEETDKHPDETDLANARAFARKVVS